MGRRVRIGSVSLGRSTFIVMVWKGNQFFVFIVFCIWGMHKESSMKTGCGVTKVEMKNIYVKNDNIEKKEIQI